MKILMVGKTGVFDTLAIALGYLNQPEINNCPNFADLALEKSKKLVKAGTDSCGNELYVVGFKIPKIIDKFNKDIESLSNINGRLQVLPISVSGETITWILSLLASLPLIGFIFLKWAKSRTLHRLPLLLNYGQKLHIQSNLEIKDSVKLVYAAKLQK
jgi:hypothetical protein